MFQRVVQGALVEAVQANIFPQAAVESWWETLTTAEAAGQFFAGFAGFLVNGRVEQSL